MFTGRRIYSGVWRCYGYKVEGGEGDFDLRSSLNSHVSETSQRQTFALYYDAHSWGWEAEVVISRVRVQTWVFSGGGNVSFCFFLYATLLLKVGLSSMTGYRL